MLKNILNLEGAQKLTSAEQKEINGGKLPPPQKCVGGTYTGNVNTCLCTSGAYIANTQTCAFGPSYNTGNVYEIATGCCYTDLIGG